jgi:serine/threonine-protein kinase HipA
VVMVEKMNVILSLKGSEYQVGQLVLGGQKIFFRYANEFLERGFSISPLKLPFSSEISTPNTIIFDGLYGVFYDSLPDGWGRLLVDRFLISRGYNLNQINPLLRLSLVGENGIGALIYRPEFDSKVVQNTFRDLDEIYQNTIDIFESEDSSDFEELYNLGGSSGGARPKVWVGYDENADTINYSSSYSSNYEPWIIKFTAQSDLSDVANIEFAYYKMATDAGINMSRSKLFKGNSGKYYFGTKRFDRNDKGRLHMVSTAGLLHDNFRLSNLDYGHIMDAGFKLENNISVYERILRLAIFNILTHNRDDHSKNFAFLMNGQGEWSFAPAFDLTFSTSSHGYHSTMVGGTSKDPTKANISHLAQTFKVDTYDILISQVLDVINKWPEYAQDAGVSTRSIKLVSSSFKSVYKSFNN